MAERWRVLIVDDDADMRVLERVLFRADDRFEVVGEAIDGADALAQVVELRPDVVVLDLAMGVMDGATALPILRHLMPDAVLAVCSAYLDDTEHLTPLGADAFVDKTEMHRELVPLLAAACSART